MIDQLTLAPEEVLKLGQKLFEKVQAHMKWDEDKTLLWFLTSNPLLGGISPVEMLLRGRGEKLEKFIDALIAENLP